MNSETGEIRTLDKGDSPLPEESRLGQGQEVKIGRLCFRIIDIDVDENQILLQGIPAQHLKRNRTQRRADWVKLQAKISKQRRQLDQAAKLAQSEG